MGFEIRQTPRGLNASWGGKFLTSAYAPVREAQQWAAGISLADGGLVFVAGDPWGLASSALSGRGARAVALLPGPEALPHLPPGTLAWSPGPVRLETFLEDVLEDFGVESVSWEVWPAFERLAPEVSLDWARRFRDVFRTVQGSWLTHRRFGRRFWLNTIRNAIHWEKPLQGTVGERPIVIAASGPSLDDGLALLHEHREYFDLWALPSSFETLVRRQLMPDLGVATDGGYYAREHLHRLAGTRVPVLASLSSAPDSELTARPVGFFSQGMAVEQVILSAFGRPYPEVPSQGTVAVTALRLALEATTGPVFIAGLDLSFRDLRGHTSPHTVDRRLEAQHSRLLPLEGAWSQRLIEQATVVHEGVRTSPALLTYARWFQTRARFSRPVYRIAPTPLHWDSMEELTWEQAALRWRTTGGPRGVWSSPSPWPDRAERRSHVERALRDLTGRIEAPQAAPNWVREVGRTAVPEAVLQDWQDCRAGRSARAVVPALKRFLESLLDEVL